MRRFRAKIKITISIKNRGGFIKAGITKLINGLIIRLGQVSTPTNTKMMINVRMKSGLLLILLEK